MSTSLNDGIFEKLIWMSLYGVWKPADAFARSALANLNVESCEGEGDYNYIRYNLSLSTTVYRAINKRTNETIQYTIKREEYQQMETTLRHEVWINETGNPDDRWRFNACFDDYSKALVESAWYRLRGYRVELRMRTKRYQESRHITTGK